MGEGKEDGAVAEFIDFKRFLGEVYSGRNMAPLRYLRSRPPEFDDQLVSHLAEHFLSEEENEDVLEQLRKITKLSRLNWTQVREEPYEYADYFYELPTAMLDRVRDYVERNSHDIYDRNQAEMPTHFHFEKDPELVRRDTWLVHFCKDPWSIKKDGFTHGTADVSRLGLTTWSSMRAKQSGGYNFAFDALGRHADAAAHSRKYGNAAVMFRHAGTRAYHAGDDEDQVIFWGPEVDRGGIVMLYGGVDERFDAGKEKSDIDSGWGVTRANRDGYVFVGEDFEDAALWVKRHFDQYRRAIS